MNNLKCIKKRYAKASLSDKVLYIAFALLVFLAVSLLVYGFLKIAIQNSFIAFVFSITLAIYASYAYTYAITRQTG